MGMSVCVFGPGQPPGCWKKMNFMSSSRMAPSAAPPK